MYPKRLLAGRRRAGIFPVQKKRFTPLKPIAKYTQIGYLYLSCGRASTFVQRMPKAATPGAHPFR